MIKSVSMYRHKPKGKIHSPATIEAKTNNTHIIDDILLLRVRSTQILTNSSVEEKDHTDTQTETQTG